MRINTGIAEAYIEEGILFINFTVLEIELEPLKKHQAEVVAAFGHLLPLPSIVQVPTGSKSANKEVRDYTTSQANTNIILSTAVIVSSAFMRTVANFYFKFAKMPTPTKLFGDVPSAIEWSKQFIK
jgi:hypothetical protein